jgi:hypothetical protein
MDGAYEAIDISHVLERGSRAIRNYSKNKKGSSPILGFLVIYKRLLKTGREKSHTAESYPM